MKVAIVGMGYVGIPLALRMDEVGLSVIGIDVDNDRIEALNAGQSPIRHITHEDVARMREAGFEATRDFARSAECDAIVICVPTPLNEYREPDLSFVIATMESLAPHLRAGQMLSLESTTWPGTTEEVLLPFVEKAGLTAGKDFFLVYSPEREDPGNAKFSTRTIPKVVGGHTEGCLRTGVDFYRRFIDKVVPVSSTGAAEMVKLLENIHRSVNIGLVNELKILTDRMGLDIFEIVDAAATKPFGFTAYYPGPGVGGHCIPIDPFYLTWKAREYGLHTRFIELAGEINAGMPQYVTNKVIHALNERGKSLKGAKVLVLGLSYKRDVDDMRESPSVFVMELLREWGAVVDYADPHVPEFPKMREHNFDLVAVEITAETLKQYDAAVLLTDHNGFDYDLIRQHASILVDARGKYRDGGPNIVRA
jgi:UDP-N-acetyl-D-glucosamine dehydrogenase